MTSPPQQAAGPPLRVAWISDYPIEWMPELPEPLRGLPRQHPATWMPVLFEEFRRRSDLELHILVLRKGLAGDFAFERDGVKFHVLKSIGGLRAPSFFWHDTFLIRRKLRELRPDLVHAWGTERGAGKSASIHSRTWRPVHRTANGCGIWSRKSNSPTRSGSIALGSASITGLIIRFQRPQWRWLLVRRAQGTSGSPVLSPC